MRRAPHPTALAAGLALIALGVLLVLDAHGTVHLRFAYTAPAVVAALGIVLLASGLQARASAGGSAEPASGAVDHAAPAGGDEPLAPS
jgi:hypothetical protein